MTTTATPQEKTDQAAPALLPLEYCRPERAAELLGCKVEDLLHWAAIGAINFYVNAAMAMDGVKTIDTYLPEGVEPKFVIEPNPMEGEFKFGAAFSFVSASGYILSDDGYCRFDAGKLYGFWGISPSHFQCWELGGGIPESDEYNLSLFSKFDFGTSAYLHDEPDIDITIEVTASFTSLKDNLWLMREDLAKINQHIHTGESFPITADDKKQRRDAMRRALGLPPLQPSPALENQQSSSEEGHGNVAVYAAGRGKILATAMRIQVLYPDICVDDERWAEAVEDHWRDVHPNEVKPPINMSSEGILNLIRHAKDTGEVYKNPKKNQKTKMGLK
ncbi:hypothetical protein K3H46_18875 [Aeromonas veronii]|uniref:hypothetical protein n=1 Tax=Aeromonas veronii TaxID=654 RepID=UPI001F18400C|nr:hypothetical protein [Aeromonas veronii]MCF5893074.1 hypothetical protein [Aeromonas veronii]